MADRPPRSTLLLPLVLAASCAIAEPDNRRTLNALDAHLTPTSTSARWLASPVALPVGVLGVAADALVVHPCCVLDDAWGDTVEWLWEPREESRFRSAVMTPLRVIASPIVFVGDWLGRATFDIPPRKEDA